MKLCPVCDRKLQTGTWCKNCKRFVKPYEISDGVHINESHSATSDADCDYHSTKQQYSKVFTAQDITHQNTNTSMTAQTKADAEKQAKLIKLIVKLVIFFWVFSIVVSVGTTIAGVLIKFDWAELFSEDHEILQETPRSGISIEDVDPEKLLASKMEWLTFCEDLDLADLVGVTPSKYIEEEEGLVFFFSAQSLVDRAKVGCDMEHFSMTAAEVDTFLPDLDREFEVIDTVQDENENYLCVGEDFAFRSFATEVTYAVNSTYVFVEYDTVSEQLHQVDIMAEDCRELGSVAYPFCQQLLFNFELSKERFLTTLLDADRELVNALEEGADNSTTLYKDNEASVILYVWKQDDSIGRCVSIAPNWDYE